MTIKVTSLSHDDLVNLFSTALYGNSALEVIYDSKDRDKVKEEDDCYEDIIAKILLSGGSVQVIDLESEEPSIGWKKEGNLDIPTTWMEFHTWDKSEQGKWGHIIYTITLQDIINGCNTQRGCDLAKTLFFDEDGDMWTAYNLMQTILFGEEIYV